MMAIYLLFPAIVVVLDYLIWQKSKLSGIGLVHVALALAGVGILILGLPFLLQNNVIMIANQTIQTSTGNILIPQYNITIRPNNATISFGFTLAELLVFIQLGFALYTFLLVAVETRRKRWQE
jgi:large-conductance mechanosensitive channel